jgi:hypothetical protein
VRRDARVWQLDGVEEMDNVLVIGLTNRKVRGGRGGGGSVGKRGG